MVSLRPSYIMDPSVFTCNQWHYDIIIFYNYMTQLIHLSQETLWWIRFGSTATTEWPCCFSLSRRRLVFIKKVYGLLALSLVTAAIGAHLVQIPIYCWFRSHQTWCCFHPANRPCFLCSVRGEETGIKHGGSFQFHWQSQDWWLGLVLSGVIQHRFEASLDGTDIWRTGMYVVFSKRDFSFIQGFLFTGLMVVVIGSLLNMFWKLIGSVHDFGAAVLLFSGFILYDTSNILRYYGTDEHVSASFSTLISRTFHCTAASSGLPEASKSFTAQRRYSGFLLLILFGTPVLLAGSIFFFPPRRF